MFSWRHKPKDGIRLGRLIEGKRVREDVRYPSPIHAMTIGPNGSGKGTGLIVPNIATLERSLFVIDPKGEAAAITLRARAKLGRVLMINPFNVLAAGLPHLKSDGFNPLAVIDPLHDNFSDDCAGIGQALVKEPPGSDGAFFGGSAQDLVTALVMFEKIARGPNANLANVRTTLTEPFTKGGLQKTITDMALSRCEPLRAKAGRFASGSR